MLEEIRVAARNDPRMRNLGGELPIQRLLALIEDAHSMVSVDTGPAHAAAALACPLVVMFGPASPLKWRPLGPGKVVVLRGERGDQSEVRDLTAAQVISAWRSAVVGDAGDPHSNAPDRLPGSDAVSAPGPSNPGGA